MIWNIARKEILNNLKSMRFPVLCVGAVVLFALNGFMFVQEYQDRHSHYVSAVRRFGGGSAAGRGTIRTNVYKKPNPLIFCVEGGERFLPERLQIQISFGPEPMSRRYENFALPEFEEIDWTFIVKVLFSIFAILLTFDTISGEKERGTLALMCSNSVPRSSILLGKYLGAMITILIPLFTGVLISLIITVLLGSQALFFEHFVRIALWIVPAVMYSSVFVFLALFISSWTHTSSTALLLLFSMWIVFVAVIPNLSGVLVDLVTRSDSEYRITKERMRLISNLSEVLKAVDAGEIHSEEALREQAVEAMRKRVKDWVRLGHGYDNSIERKRQLARNLSRVSPSALFQYAGEHIMVAGVERQRQFERAAQHFAEIYEGYVREKVGEMIPYPKLNVTYNFRFQGKRIGVRLPFPKEYRGDMSDFPVFVEAPFSLGENLSHGLLDFCLLALWNVLLMLLALAAFLRYDVR